MSVYKCWNEDYGKEADAVDIFAETHLVAGRMFYDEHCDHIRNPNDAVNVRVVEPSGKSWSVSLGYTFEVVGWERPVRP